VLCRRLRAWFCPPAPAVPRPAQPYDRVPLRASSGQQPSSLPAPSLGRHGSPVPGARFSRSCWPSATSALIRILAELASAAWACGACFVLTVEGLQNGSCRETAAMCRRSRQTFPTCRSVGRVLQLLQVEGGVSYNLTYLPWHSEVWWSMMHDDTYSAFASRRLPLRRSVSSVNLTSMQSAYSDVTTKMSAG